MEINNKEELLNSGGYAKKQIFSDYKILRWSHGSRFKKGISIVKKNNPNSIMDYGCGDATFLIYLEKLVKKKVGFEISKAQLEQLNNRFLNKDDFEFYHTDESVSQTFDMITCFEVLEHCTDENIKLIIQRLLKLLHQKGKLIISVPKETGLTMIAKQTIRKILGWKKYGSYEYNKSYSFIDFFKMLFATKKSNVERFYYEVDPGGGMKYTTCDHYAFNWKYLKLILEEFCLIEKVSFTPKIVPFGLISSQVWFECRQRKNSV